MGSISGNTRKTKEKKYEKQKKNNTNTKRGNDSCSWRERQREWVRERGEWKSCWCASLTAVSGRSTCALKRRHRANDNGATTSRARQPITNRNRIKIRIEVAIGIYPYLSVFVSVSFSRGVGLLAQNAHVQVSIGNLTKTNIIIMWIAEWIPSECVPTSSVECWMVCAKRIEALPRSRRRIRANAVEFQLKNRTCSSSTV